MGTELVHALERSADEKRFFVAGKKCGGWRIPPGSKKKKARQKKMLDLQEVEWEIVCVHYFHSGRMSPKTSIFWIF